MATHVPTRDEALALLREYNPTEGLVKHGMAVEAAMRRFARRFGEDPEVWGIVGLIHDVDYERFPAEHCRKTPEILGERGWPAEYIRAAVSHGWGICSDVEPVSRMEKTLYAVDELTGLVVTTALVRPSRSVMDVTASSVRKKWKDKRFAAGVDRSIIEKGVALLGMELDDVIAETIEGMKEAAPELGLAGTAS
jgi:predicted hydrolase (HD superfamily)